MGDIVQGPLPAPHPIPANTPIYRPANANGRLWQGEVLEGVVQIKPTLESIQANIEGQLDLTPVIHDFVIVMTQDCDLDQDYNRRNAGERESLPNILLCDVYLAEVLRTRVREQDQLGLKDWRRRIAQNQADRFHYLQRVRPEEDLQHAGLTALALDFKLYFTMPTDELYARLHTGIRRRCILNSPYAEHLAHRFFKFQSRVALPADYEIDPVEE